MRILMLSPDLNYSDGRSYYVSKLTSHLRREGNFVHVLTNGGDSLERIGNEITVLPCLKSKTSFVRSLNSLAELIKRLDIDIVHTHHRYFELVANSLPRRKVRTVTTALSIVDRRYFVDFRSDRIIAVSNAVRKMLTGKFGVRESKISLIPNFVESAEAHMNSGHSKKVNGRNDKTVILSAGRFHREKDQMTMLKSMKLLRDKNIELILIGEGPEENALRKFAEGNNLKVKFLSVQKDLTPFIQQADICALSSVRDPLPGFMLQSGLHGRLFIGSDADGIPEVINHKVNGLIFPKRDAESLANEIIFAARNKHAAEQMGKELKKIILGGFTEKTTVPIILNLYEDLLRGR